MPSDSDSLPSPDTASEVAYGAAGAESNSTLLFAIVALVVVVGVALGSARFPVSLRPVGLFVVLTGLVMGGLLTLLCHLVHAPATRGRLIAMGFLTLAGLIASTCQTVALQLTTIPEAPVHPIAKLVDDQLGQSSKPDFALQFRKYLNDRLEVLGSWPSPLPEIVWGLELLLGTGGAMLIAWQYRVNRPPATD